MKLLILLLLAQPLSVHASALSDFYNDRAAKKDREGDHKTAGENLNKALQADASDPLVIYNWSINKIKRTLQAAGERDEKKLNEEDKKELESANKQLLSLEPKLKDSKIPENQYFYQLGISHQLLNDKKNALLSYYKALAKTEKSPENKDFIEATQINILRLLAQSPSSSSSSSSGEGGGEGQNQDQEGQDGQSQQDKGEGQGQTNPQQKPQEPKFTGTDVDENQAQQILNSVSNQDRQVQRKKGQMQSKQNLNDGEEGDIDPRRNDKPW